MFTRAAVPASSLVVSLSLVFVTSASSAAELPNDAELIAKTWCYATNGGTDLETWDFQANGRVEIVTMRDGGNVVRRTSRGATWRLRGPRLIIRNPSVTRRVLTIGSAEDRRLIFTDGTHALVCRPR